MSETEDAFKAFNRIEIAAHCVNDPNEESGDIEWLAEVLTRNLPRIRTVLTKAISAEKKAQRCEAIDPVELLRDIATEFDANGLTVPALALRAKADHILKSKRK